MPAVRGSFGLCVCVLCYVEFMTAIAVGGVHTQCGVQLQPPTHARAHTHPRRATLRDTHTHTNAQSRAHTHARRLALGRAATRAWGARARPPRACVRIEQRQQGPAMQGRTATRPL